MSDIVDDIFKSIDKGIKTSASSNAIEKSKEEKSPNPFHIEEEKGEKNLYDKTVNPKDSSETFPLDVFDKQLPKDQLFKLHEGNVIEPWKLEEDVSARLIDHYDDVVVLECLVDREAKVYIETELEKRMFEGLSLEVGTLFKLSKYIRKNETRYVIHSKPHLVSDLDFPKLDFHKKYGDNFFNPE